MYMLHNDPEKLVNEFSKQFKKGFVAVLSKRYRDRTVNANRVYNEYIQDKHHVHMTSTKWVTLSSFCKDLAKEENGITITPSAIGYDIKYVKVSKSLERQRKKQELLKKQDILRISKLEAEEKLKLRERRRIAAKKALEYSEKRRLLLSRQREAEEQRRKLGIEDSESGSTEEGSDFDDIFDDFGLWEHAELGGVLDPPSARNRSGPVQYQPHNHSSSVRALRELSLLLCLWGFDIFRTIDTNMSFVYDVEQVLVPFLLKKGGLKNLIYKIGGQPKRSKVLMKVSNSLLDNWVTLSKTASSCGLFKKISQVTKDEVFISKKRPFDRRKPERGRHMTPLKNIQRMKIALRCLILLHELLVSPVHVLPEETEIHPSFVWIRREISRNKVTIERVYKRIYSSVAVRAKMSSLEFPITPLYVRERKEGAMHDFAEQYTIPLVDLNHLSKIFPKCSSDFELSCVCASIWHEDKHFRLKELWKSFQKDEDKTDTVTPESTTSAADVPKIPPGSWMFCEDLVTSILEDPLIPSLYLVPPSLLSPLLSSEHYQSGSLLLQDKASTLPSLVCCENIAGIPTNKTQEAIEKKRAKKADKRKKWKQAMAEKKEKKKLKKEIEAATGKRRSSRSSNRRDNSSPVDSSHLHIESVVNEKQCRTKSIQRMFSLIKQIQRKHSSPLKDSADKQGECVKLSPLVKPSDVVFADYCAAPGQKTLHLSDLSSSHVVFSFERDSERERVLRSRVYSPAGSQGLVFTVHADCSSIVSFSPVPGSSTISTDPYYLSTTFFSSMRDLSGGRKQLSTLSPAASKDLSVSLTRLATHILVDPSCSSTGMFKGEDRMRGERVESFVADWIHKGIFEDDEESLDDGEGEEGEEGEEGDHSSMYHSLPPLLKDLSDSQILTPHSFSPSRISEVSVSLSSYFSSSISQKVMSGLIKNQLSTLLTALMSPCSSIVVYSTCSICSDENEKVIAEALKKVEGYDLEGYKWRLKNAMPEWKIRGLKGCGLSDSDAQCVIRSNPFISMCNGFFVAVFERYKA
ncbi:hypothetical protein ADUPG1_008667 [Aduncisulcus paluster]|uniref:SAM-dependent MTase RsmB/NOP-type domain-containing protein n=1 Tax=Aduncisulcus paluster TaxID=2918883 RepID=A0ABQ5KU07_9EUKA|nr:hypothetical protein ADUPG1_008667 [Aduncisulcus paluster]